MTDTHTLSHSIQTQQAVLRLAHVLMQKYWMLASAESCSGGMVAAACTDLAGSSAWFERGFVTYSNAAKIQQLGIDTALINQHGAVSEAVASAMAQGALLHSIAHVALAIPGVAGPAGGTLDKPVGTVWFAWAMPEGIHSELRHFEGDRAAVRQASALHSLLGLLSLIESPAT
jgi:nicotinamide-nucleotide amidase